jgi:hypothetical protein
MKEARNFGKAMLQLFKTKNRKKLVSGKMLFLVIELGNGYRKVDEVRYLMEDCRS